MHAFDMQVREDTITFCSCPRLMWNRSPDTRMNMCGSHQLVPMYPQNMESIQTLRSIFNTCHILISHVSPQPKFLSFWKRPGVSALLSWETELTLPCIICPAKRAATNNDPLRCDGQSRFDPQNELMRAFIVKIGLIPDCIYFDDKSILLYELQW